MPGLNGFQGLQKIREVEPSTKIVIRTMADTCVNKGSLVSGAASSNGQDPDWPTTLRRLVKGDLRFYELKKTQA